MGTQPSLFIFDYEYYEKALVPFLRDMVAGRPLPNGLREVVERFGKRNNAAKPFRMPARGCCQHLAPHQTGCYCLRADLGLEPDHYIFRPDYFYYRPVGPQDSACGLFTGMNYWSRDEEDFVELFNGLLAANCLSDEQWLRGRMYLWDCQIVDETQQVGDPSWIWKCTDFLTRSRPLWLALYRRGCHIGSYRDPGGIMGWLTPAEVRALYETITVDLPPPPFERPNEYSAQNYDACEDYELFDDLTKVAAWCKRAASSASGLVGSYLLFPSSYDWARIRPLAPQAKSVPIT